MKRTLASAVTAVVAAPLVISASLLGAQPANAFVTQNCANPYPPGSAYRPTSAPLSANVRQGSDVTLLPRLVRGAIGCNNQGIRFWTRTSIQSQYRAGAFQSTRPYSIGDGFAVRTVQNTSITFRWFIQFRTQASNISQVTVRR